MPAAIAQNKRAKWRRAFQPRSFKNWVLWLSRLPKERGRIRPCYPAKAAPRIVGSINGRICAAEQPGSYNVRRPLTKLMISMTSATTSRIWMNPLKVYELTRPSSHKTRRITAIVVSIIYLSSYSLPLYICPPFCSGVNLWRVGKGLNGEFTRRTGRSVHLWLFRGLRRADGSVFA